MEKENIRIKFIGMMETHPIWQNPLLLDFANNRR